jgi:hypothetical protein
MALAWAAAFTSARLLGEVKICAFLAQIPGEAALPHAQSAFEPAGGPLPPTSREWEQRRRATCDDPTPQQREGRAVTGALSPRVDTFTLRTHRESLQAGSSWVPLRDGRQFSIDVNGADPLTASAPPDPTRLSRGPMRATAVVSSPGSKTQIGGPAGDWKSMAARHSRSFARNTTCDPAISTELRASPIISKCPRDGHHPPRQRIIDKRNTFLLCARLRRRRQQTSFRRAGEWAIYMWERPRSCRI